jgi:hypothetical protein
MKKVLLASLALLAAATMVGRADIIPTFTGTSTIDEQSTVWNYTINITKEQNATVGDFFTIYDFGSFIAGSNVQPAGWTFSSSLVGTTPSQINAADNPNILNLTWTYNGPTIIGNSPAGLNIGPFSVSTAGFLGDTVPSIKSSMFAAQGTLAGGPTAGSKVNNVGNISVPAAIPEPSTIALILGSGGLGMVGRALARRRRF